MLSYAWSLGSYCCAGLGSPGILGLARDLNFAHPDVNSCLTRRTFGCVYYTDISPGLSVPINGWKAVFFSLRTWMRKQLPALSTKILFLSFQTTRRLTLHALSLMATRSAAASSSDERLGEHPISGDKVKALKEVRSLALCNGFG